MLQETNPLFLIFVAALGVVVDAATSHGLQDDLAALLPTGTSLLALLALAVIAAVLANLINNLPATLVLLAALGAKPAAGAVLAMLIGVNVGPNLTYTGSLATLLWRRVLHAKGHRPSLARFTVLGLLTVPGCLLLRHRCRCGSALASLLRDGTGSGRPAATAGQHLFVRGLGEVAVTLVDRSERFRVAARRPPRPPPRSISQVSGADRHRDDQPRRPLPATAATAARMVAPVASPSSTMITTRR